MTLEITEDALRVHDAGVTKALVHMKRVDGMLTFYDLESESAEALLMLARAFGEIKEKVYTVVNGDNPKYARLLEFYEKMGFRPLSTILST